MMQQILDVHAGKARGLAVFQGDQIMDSGIRQIPQIDRFKL